MKLKLLLSMLICFSFLAACSPAVVQTSTAVVNTQDATEAPTPGPSPTVTQAAYVAPPSTPSYTPAPYVPPPSTPSYTPAPYVPPPSETTSTPSSGGPTSAPNVTPTHVPVDLTPAQRAAIQVVVKKYNIPVDKIQLLSTEAVTWPDGCMGVVLPGVLCAHHVVDGFRIRLSADGQQFEIHTDQSGSSALDAAQQLGTLRFVVSNADQTIQVVDPNIGLGQTYNPAFTGLFPAGGTISGTAYVLDMIKNQAVAVDARGTHDLSFIQKPNYTLAVWRGGAGSKARLAWGTTLVVPDHPSSLQISGVDGSDLQTLLTEPVGANPPYYQLAAQFWSADGQALYYSREPIGLGGYIPFGGASSLYRIDLATKKITELIPVATDPQAFICIDAISGDYRFTADHCTVNVITIRELATGKTTPIQPPADVTGFRLVGSARFSPDGSQVAFALAKGDPSNEQGWVAVSDITSGSSKLIYTGQPNASFLVLGWLDGQTLLLQSNAVGCSATCTNQIWTVGVDGSNPTKVADGALLAVLDNQ